MTPGDLESVRLNCRTAEGIREMIAWCEENKANADATIQAFPATSVVYTDKRIFVRANQVVTQEFIACLAKAAETFEDRAIAIVASYVKDMPK